MAEASSGRSAMTDANGSYSISGLRAMNGSVSVSKPGYVSHTQTLTIGGDTQLEIRVNRVTTYTLSGVVFEVTEAGRVPIAGVDVYCDGCGSPVGHTFAYTDADGSYRFLWTYNGATPILVKKAGYGIVDATARLTGEYWLITAMVDGDTRFDIQLSRR